MARFHVLGAGSVGQLIAHALRQHAFPVTLLARREALVQEFRASGSLLTCQYGPGQFLIEKADMELVQGSGTEIRNLVVSTKGNDVVDAVRSVRERLLADCSIILIQNGMLAVYQELWNEVLSGWDASSRPRVIVGSLTHGAYLASSFHLFHSSRGKGTCTFAEVDASLPCLSNLHHQQKWTEPRSLALQALLSLHSLSPEHPHTHRDLLRQLQLKMAVNCAINPLTATLGCLNGQLLEDPNTRDAMRAVCNELHEILQPNIYTTAQEMFQTVCKVATATAQNRSSMLQDLSMGRPTELPFLNGFAVRQGLTNKVPVPVNTLLHQLVSFQERHSKDRSQRIGLSPLIERAV